MSDYSELECLAQAAIDAIGTLSRARQEREFNDVCTPQVVKALIAENDLQRKDLQNLRTDNAQLIYALKQEQKSYLVLRAERDQLKAELEKAQMIGRLAYNFDGYKAVLDERDQLRAEVAGLKTGYEAYERVNAELKAENEALRKDAERYRWLRDSDYAGKILRDMGAKYRADSDQRIDAAMGKGDRP